MANGSTSSKNRMQKMVDKVNGPTDPPKKTPEYKEFQSDSTRLSEHVKNPNEESKAYFNKKYSLKGEHLPSVQKSWNFYEDASFAGYRGKKYEDGK
jgi:hypothetical protein